jgi:hypothetical protein
VAGNFLDYRLGRLIVVPETGLGGFGLKFVNLLFELVEVKDTSRASPSEASGRPLCCRNHHSLLPYLTFVK